MAGFFAAAFFAGFFAVAFAGATDPAEAVPSLTATDGALTGDLVLRGIAAAAVVVILAHAYLGRRGLDNGELLMLLLFALLVAMAWGYTQVFTGRAALLHLGAFTATIMSANVFFIIMPNQRIVVADLKANLGNVRYQIKKRVDAIRGTL